MRVLVLLSAVVTMLAAYAQVQAQCPCDSLKQAIDGQDLLLMPMVDDSTVDSSMAITIDRIGPRFQYDYETDSSHVQWTFSEFLKNGRKLFLSSWCLDSIINYDQTGDSVVQEWTESELNARSITKTFPVSTGDTVGFYKAQWIAKRGQSGPTYDYYKNPDVLSYSVELIDSTLNSRIALLDTGMYASTTLSYKPCIVGWYPMYVRIRYVIPSGYTDSLVFIRVNTYSSGPTADPWVRTDLMHPMLSDIQLSSSVFSNYCDSIEASSGCSTGGSCNMSASTSSTPPGITVSVSTPTSITDVAIVNLYGNVQWSSGVPLPSNPTTVGLSGGLYIVVAYNNGLVTCTKKIVVP